MIRPRAGVYLDASALVKLVLTEPESAALRRFLGRERARFSSRVASVEVRRAVDRQHERDAAAQVEALLEGMQLIELDGPMAAAAALVPPPSLHTLDAIHLAAAASLASEGVAFVTYDARLADAARAAGLTVAAPA